MASATETKPAAATRPSVLTELGLGNEVPTATAQEATHEATTKPVETPAQQSESPPVATAGVEADTTKQAAEAKTEAKPDDKVTEKSKTEETDKDRADLAKLQKQLTDTRNAFTQERQVNKTLLAKQQALEQKIDILTKKIDGTYDEAKDAPKTPTVDEAKQSERVATSHWAAVDQYGEEFVMKTVWADDAPFRQFDHDAAVQARVISSKTPILEAIQVVKEAETKAKYGSDPDAMRKAIEQEVRQSLEKELRQKILKETAGRTQDDVKGLANVRQATETNPAEPARLNFDSLFPGFQKSAG